ncbi:LAME_0E09934g1_1 [Lachancea meyersii CBS 8951]|uniref:Ribosome biogenesis protein RLP7 n=1 Tax=Lachancea meyersii CBS 8951 TaxID=1266667 RepID=A0A1G4JKF2_9SACH|nr:LAME_0E09934g1_1 [Lachancea meyersii CBS 8951]
MVAGLDSNPEILLRKRRNADRTRLEKQELAQRRKEQQQKQKRARKNKFERAESIVATSLATQREKERIKRVSKLEAQRHKGETQHLASDRDFILKVRELTSEEAAAAAAAADDANDEDENSSLHTEKCIYDGKPTLLFVLRIRGPTAAKIPQKAHKVLSLLRLSEVNTGVFVRLSPQVYPLLKLVAPYVVVGEPSLASVRSLIHKRSRVLLAPSDGEEPRETILNDNNVVEEKLGSEGIICVEDIIHEIATLGDSFAKCNFFLLPFRLNREVSGFSAISKLHKIRQREWQKRALKVSNASTAPVVQVDVDSLIAKLN